MSLGHPVPPTWLMNWFQSRGTNRFKKIISIQAFKKMTLMQGAARWSMSDLPCCCCTSWPCSWPPCTNSPTWLCHVQSSLFAFRYIFGSITQDQLAAFYRDAQVCLVTPLRDGMNLVAKEFVACQDEEDPGVLILSPFAGAGPLMQEALQVSIVDRRPFGFDTRDTRADTAQTTRYL